MPTTPTRQIEMGSHVNRESNAQLLSPFSENDQQNVAAPVNSSARPDVSRFTHQQSQFWPFQVGSATRPAIQPHIAQQWQPEPALQASNGVRPHINPFDTQWQPRPAYQPQSAMKPNISPASTQQSQHGQATQFSSILQPPVINPFVAQQLQRLPVLQANGASTPNINPLSTQQLEHGLAMEVNSAIRPPIINNMIIQQQRLDPSFQVTNTLRQDVNPLITQQSQYGQARQANGTFRPGICSSISQQAQRGQRIPVPSTIRASIKPLVTQQPQYSVLPQVNSSMRPNFNPFDTAEPESISALPVQTHLKDRASGTTVNDIIRYCDAKFNVEEFDPKVGPPEASLQGCCLSCPEWFWPNARHCVQCEVDKSERWLKMRKVLQMAAMYKSWIAILSDSGVNVTRRWEYLLECNRRLSWLQERQEFIRVETERVMKEVEIGHNPAHCRCQGVSGWVYLNHSRP